MEMSLTFVFNFLWSPIFATSQDWARGQCPQNTDNSEGIKPILNYAIFFFFLNKIGHLQIFINIRKLCFLMADLSKELLRKDAWISSREKRINKKVSFTLPNTKILKTIVAWHTCCLINSLETTD